MTQNRKTEQFNTQTLTIFFYLSKDTILATHYLQLNTVHSKQKRRSSSLRLFFFNIKPVHETSRQAVQDTCPTLSPLCRQGAAC